MNAFLSPEVLILGILETVLLLFLSLSFGVAVGIARHFKISATTPQQYRLERQSYLVSVIISFALLIKGAVFLYFIFTLDKLSAVITGAMCAAGVVTATDYGIYLLILKLANLFFFGFWLVLHRLDSRHETYPFTRVKFTYFAALFPLLILEFILFLLHVDGLDPAAIVSCCGVLFSAGNTSVIGDLTTLPDRYTLSLFSLLFALILFAAFTKNYRLLLGSTLLFLPVALLAIINVFSTYVYELPTHRCPFCLLQKEYGYTGYLGYLLLFGGTFLLLAQSLAKLLLNEESGYLKRGMWLLVFFVAWAGYYPIHYYLTNGVFL